MSNKKLKEYLEKLYEIEKVIYQEELIKQALLNKLNKQVKYYKIQKIKNSDQKGANEELAMSLGSFCAAIVAILIANSMDNIWVWILAIIIAGALGMTGIVVFMSYTTTASLADKERAENARKINENEIAEKKNELLRLQTQRDKVAAEAQIKIIDEVLKETKRIREVCYSIGIIHPKYRNFVAISSIYEYIDTGRCRELTGPHGAYDTFEYMQQLKEIKTDLNIIIHQLDSIRRTQEMLYYAIDESNRLSRSMLEGFRRTEDQIVQANKSLSDVKEYQRQSLEYNRIVANNSEFLKWLAVFER